MAFPPPPYDQITGVSRADMKDNAQETLANYDGNARPGELVTNLAVDPPSVWVGNNIGRLTQLAMMSDIMVNKIIAGTNVTISPLSGQGNVTINALNGSSWANLGDRNNALGPTNISLGQQAGNTTQGANAIAIGSFAGNTAQGANSIAIGSGAGATSQPANSIVLNATGANVNAPAPDTFVVQPVRNGGTGGGLPAGFLNVGYNPTTGEFVFWS